jgi:hypothetical protein
MQAILDQKIREVEDGTWKLRFKDHEVVVKDLGEPVIRMGQRLHRQRP